MSWDTPEIYQQFCQTDPGQDQFGKTDPGQDQFGKTDLGLYITGLYMCYPICIYLLSCMYSGLSLAYTLVIHEIYLYNQAITCMTTVYTWHIQYVWWFINGLNLCYPIYPRFIPGLYMGYTSVIQYIWKFIHGLSQDYA